MVSVLLSASVERFSVYRMQDFSFLEKIGQSAWMKILVFAMAKIRRIGHDHQLPSFLPWPRSEGRTGNNGYKKVLDVGKNRVAKKAKNQRLCQTQKNKQYTQPTGWKYIWHQHRRLAKNANVWRVCFIRETAKFFWMTSRLQKWFWSLFVSKYFFFWMTMKNLEKNSWFLPYPKVKDDHAVVA